MKKLVLSLFAVAALVPAAALAQQMPVRVGGNVTAPERIHYVQPDYPMIAQQSRVSGIVIVEAIIGPNGSVTDAKVIRSIALLDEAALDAVRQWKYTPTTLNGVGVPVIMTVTVNFALQGPPHSPLMSDDSNKAIVQQLPETRTEPVFLNGKQALRIGGTVKAPDRTKWVPPVYPQAAQSALVSGVVIVEVVIDEAGHVAQAKVIRSVALLDQAALDAILQWEYAPTLLNGVAVPVVMTVTVNFTLQ